MIISSPLVFRYVNLVLRLVFAIICWWKKRVGPHPTSCKIRFLFFMELILLFRRRKLFLWLSFVHAMGLLFVKLLCHLLHFQILHEMLWENNASSFFGEKKKKDRLGNLLTPFPLVIPHWLVTFPERIMFSSILLFARFLYQSKKHQDLY